MVKMINTALATAYGLFNAAHPGIHAAAAYLQYNAQTGLFSMCGLTSYATGANPAKVFVNTQLYKYLDTIPARFYGFNRPGGCDYQIDFELRTTMVPEIVSAEDVFFNLKFIPAGAKYVLQQFLNNNVQDAYFKNIVPYAKEELKEIINKIKQKLVKIWLRD